MADEVKATMQDVKDAQRAHSDHMTAHRCRVGDGCKERLDALAEINRVSLMWNEPA
jgi:hypothetical protein